HLDRWSQRRRNLAKFYDTGLAEVPITLPFTPAGYQHVYHLYVIECQNRDALQTYLASQGITALTHYPIAIHQQEGFPWGRPARVHSLPVTEESAASVLSLPMYPELTDHEVERVVQEVLNWTANRQALSKGAN
ncbi:MAG: DegT/DnrJ/EryC1/StrS family aminotransferase, partial [Candidatus Acidiferrales bacterium]